MGPTGVFGLKLLLAHLIGDFPLQPGAWAHRKRGMRPLLLHLGVHALLLALVVASEPDPRRVAGPVAALLVAHGAIDWLMGAGGEKGPWRIALDQALHLIAIGGCVGLARRADLTAMRAEVFDALSRPEPYVFAIGLVAAVWVGSVFVGRWVRGLAAGLPAMAEEDRIGLERAGRWIGMAERLIIFLAIYLGSEALAGLVMAAKAILRLPEATERRSRALAEYYLLGTLMSAAWAVLAGLAIRWLVPPGR